MSAGHTPGPWTVVPYGDGDSLVVHDARGDWRVCFMATPGADGDMASIRANARLITAAPELLDVAIEAEQMFLWYGNLHAAKPDPEKANRNYEMAARIATAIAIATGEA